LLNAICTPGEPVYDERCRRLGDRWFNDLACLQRPSVETGFDSLSERRRSLVAIMINGLSQVHGELLFITPEMDVCIELKR
jgi:hypothetical protein